MNPRAAIVAGAVLALAGCGLGPRFDVSTAGDAEPLAVKEVRSDVDVPAELLDRGGWGPSIDPGQYAFFKIDWKRHPKLREEFAIGPARILGRLPGRGWCPLQARTFAFGCGVKLPVDLAPTPFLDLKLEGDGFRTTMVRVENPVASSERQDPGRAPDQVRALDLGDKWVAVVRSPRFTDGEVRLLDFDAASSYGKPTGFASTAFRPGSAISIAKMAAGGPKSIDIVGKIARYEVLEEGTQAPQSLVARAATERRRVVERYDTKGAYWSDVNGAWWSGAEPKEVRYRVLRETGRYDIGGRVPLEKIPWPGAPIRMGQPVGVYFTELKKPQADALLGEIGP